MDERGERTALRACSGNNFKWAARNVHIRVKIAQLHRELERPLSFNNVRCSICAVSFVGHSASQVASSAVHYHLKLLAALVEK